jgi:PAS domain S-box-containing protein
MRLIIAWRKVGLFYSHCGVIDQIKQQQNLPQRKTAIDEAKMNKTVDSELLKIALDEHAIVSVTDASGNIIHVNNRFTEISGYTRFELLGTNHRILKSGLHSPEFYRQMWETLSEGKTWQGDVCNRSKNGELYWVHATVKPVLDENGLPIQYISIRTEITEIINIGARLRLTIAELEAYWELSDYELGIARKLMEHMNDKLSTPVKEVELWLHAATKLSGDLVITQQYCKDRSYILLADAMGHGLPAALPLIPIVQVFSAMAQDGFTVSAIVREMNKKLKDLIPTGNFVAVTLVSVDRGNRFIDIWNGGNPAALLIDESGNVSRKFKSQHPAIGILNVKDFDSATECFHWDEPCWLTLYSDGLTEAQDVHGVSLGEEQVVRALQKKQPHQSLKETVLAHLGEGNAVDDISLATVCLVGGC